MPTVLDQTDAADRIRQVLTRATARLHRVSDTPELDAGLLLAHVLDKPRSFLFAHGGDAVEPAERAVFEALVERRRAGEPVAYLVGTWGFWSLDLAVDARVLVPRPDTETLVETALSLLPTEQPATVADLGTGSGAIALAIARERPNCRVLATDASRDALAVATHNAERLALDNIDFAEGDWFAALGDTRFDMIVSNPPYVAEDDPHLTALTHEPRAALVADDNGCSCLRRLAEGAAAHLVPGGWLVLEHGPDQGFFARHVLGRCGFRDVRTDQDLGDRPRVTLGMTRQAR